MRTLQRLKTCQAVLIGSVVVGQQTEFFILGLTALQKLVISSSHHLCSLHPRAHKTSRLPAPPFREGLGEGQD
jgi:hypothetical protein